MTQHTKSIIELEHVSFDYGDDTILEDISLHVQAGDYLGIIGPNGSGKTTLLRLMLGVLKPQKGNIHLFGKDVQAFTAWEKIGYVPQKVAQSIDTRFPMTVEELVSLGRVRKKTFFTRLHVSDYAAIDKAIAITGLSDLRTRRIGNLSGGQLQRAYIARALAGEPELLILDEPTVGVDIDAQEKFYDFLATFVKAGITLILVSHDIDVMVNEVNTLACLNKTLVFHGNPKDFISNNYLEKLYGKRRQFVLHNH